MNLKRRERIEVEMGDGRELTVFNWANIKQRSMIYAAASNVVTDTIQVGAGDSHRKPDAITHWIAEELWHEHGYDAEENGIEVVDVTDDEVTCL